MEKYSIQQIKESYIQKKEWEKSLPASYYIFRPLSFYIAYLVLKITNSPGKVAWFGLGTGLSGCISLLFLKDITIWPGIILLLSFALLDAVDGNIARTTKSVSYYGKYLDGATGIITEANYFLCLGIGLFLNSQNNYYLVFGTIDKTIFIILGCIITVCLLLSGNFESGYDKHRISKEVSEKKTSDSYQYNLSANIEKSKRSQNVFFLLYINLHAYNFQLIVLTICAIFSFTHIFILFYAAYYLLRALLNFMFFTYRAAKTLN